MLTKAILKDKILASLMHLLASVIVAMVAALLVIKIWYPYPHWQASGGAALLQLLIAVDVVAGPVLTLVAFNRLKPRNELRRDLLVIFVLQFSALMYGLFSVHQSRPLFMIHEVDRFVVVYASDLSAEDQAESTKRFQSTSEEQLPLIGLKATKAGAERMDAILQALEGKDRSMRPEFWQTLSAENLQTIRSRSRPMSEWMAASESFRVASSDWLAKNRKEPSELLIFPMQSRTGFWSAVLDAKTLQISGYLPFDPL